MKKNKVLPMRREERRNNSNKESPTRDNGRKCGLKDVHYDSWCVNEKFPQLLIIM